MCPSPSNAGDSRASHWQTYRHIDDELNRVDVAFAYTLKHGGARRILQGFSEKLAASLLYNEPSWQRTLRPSSSCLADQDHVPT